MSVVEPNKIDAMGKSKESNELSLLITDHLGWENEYDHLVILQDKINSYLSFIESKQYESTYPQNRVGHPGTGACSNSLCRTRKKSRRPIGTHSTSCR